MKKTPLVLLMVLAVCGVAVAADVTGATLTGSGIFSEKHRGVQTAPDTAAGFIYTASQPKLVRATDEVVAKRGTSFGIMYTINGEPTNATVPLVVRVHHPRMYNPETKETTRVGEYRTKAAIGGPNYDAYTFAHDWEMVPGKWTFEVSHAGRVLLTKSFNVRLAK